MIRNFFYFSAFSLVVFLIFRSFFGFDIVSFGDAPFQFFQSTDVKIFSFPCLWSLNGLGEPVLMLNSFYYFYFFPRIFLFFPWGLIEKISWYWPFLGLSIFSSWYLLKKLKIQQNFVVTGSLFYLSNSYILMIIGGGQISIALSYALLPLTLLIFIKTVQRTKARSVALMGLVFALQLSFEPRFFLVGLVVCLFYYLFNFKFKIGQLVKSFGLPIVLTGLIHLFWILPLFLTRRQPFEASLAKTDWLSFLSLAQFSNSLSLLHPNWPENIFGKTYFFSPLFLVLPLMAFSSLLFINLKKRNKKTRKVLFFVFIGLLGAFLSKGINPPFGFIYRFFYENVPFFNTFRDPVKFYFLTALSYVFLIPFSLQKIYFSLSRINKKAGVLFVFSFVLIFLVLIKPAWTGKLGGTFKTKEIPSEYLQLKEFLLSQDDFFRTLWLPKRHRFGFYSHRHPAIDGENSFGPNYCLTDICRSERLIDENWGQECPANDRCYVKELAFLLDPKTEKLLQILGVKYLIVPSDSEGEIFITEYKYNPQQRGEVEQFLDQVEWLDKIDVVDKIAVYQVSDFKDHFFVKGGNGVEIDWQQINPTKYKVEIGGAKEPFRLVFSEKFDPFWQIKVDNQVIGSEKYEEILNGFWIEKTGNFELSVEFAPQRYVYWGGIVSLIVLIGSISYLVYNKL